MNIAMILQAKFPGAEWSLSGENYEGLNWMSDSKKPTEKQLEKLWPEVQAAEQRSIVEFNRRMAYQEMADPLFFKWQAGLATEAEWKTARAEVEKLFPHSA